MKYIFRLKLTIFLCNDCKITALSGCVISMVTYKSIIKKCTCTEVELQLLTLTNAFSCIKHTQVVKEFGTNLAANSQLTAALLEIQGESNWCI